MLSKEEHKRYARHLALPDFGLKGQEKIKQAKILVIGAGGLGAPILQYLTAAGVGTIGIVENDTVDLTNLQRQVLYKSGDIGKPKIDCAVESLAALNPNVTFNKHKTWLTPDNALEIVGEYDVVIDGTDNFATRYLSNERLRDYWETTDIRFHFPV